MAQDTILVKSLYDFLKEPKNFKKREFLEWHLSFSIWQVGQ